MKLDFSELKKGVREELAKKANVPVTPSHIYTGPLPSGISTAAGSVANASKSLVPALAKPAAGAVAKSLGGMAAKALPYVGTVVHGGMAINDARQGDWTGAALNAGGALANLLPIPGASLPFDAIYAARGLKNMAMPAVSGALGNTMSTVGKYAPALMGGLAALERGNQNAAMQHAGYPSPQRMPQANPLNLFNTTNMDPHSLSAPQLFNEKLAKLLKKKASIVEALRGAAARKMVDSVVDPVHLAPDAEAQLLKEKELEITSKHPEIAAILEDQKNKEYLEKLLKE